MNTSVKLTRANLMACLDRAAAAARHAAVSRRHADNGARKQPAERSALTAANEANYVIHAILSEDVDRVGLAQLETRAERLAAAAWLLISAGSDHDRHSIDFDLGAHVLSLAADD